MHTNKTALFTRTHQTVQIHIKMGVRERSESRVKRKSTLLSSEGLASSSYNNMPRPEEEGYTDGLLLGDRKEAWVCWPRVALLEKTEDKLGVY